MLGKQFVAVGATLAFSFVVTLLVAKLVDATVGLRVTTDDEITGLDLSQHSEVGYSLAESSGSSMQPVPVHEHAHATAAIRVPQGGEV